MADESARLAAEVESGTAATLGLLRGLTEREWFVVTPDGGWTVGEVVRHLGEVDEKVAAILPLAEGGREEVHPPSGENHLPRAVVERYQRGAARLGHAVRTLSPAALAEPVVIPGLGSLPRHAALGFRSFEQFHHTFDILRAVRPAVPHLPALVGPALRFMRAAGPHIVARDRIGSASARFAFSFTEAEAWSLAIHAGEVEVRAVRGETPTAKLGGQGALFLLGLVLEKIPWRDVLRSRAVTIHGDVRALQRLRCCVPLLVPEI